MNADNFKAFSEAYRAALCAAVAENPDEYFTQGATPAEYSETVSAHMMGNIASGHHFTNNYDGKGFKGACKALGIRHTRKAILTFLGVI